MLSRVLVTQLCPTLCNPTDYSPPGSSVHRILQARILEWVAMPSSRGSSQPRDQTQISHNAGRFFNIWATREALCYYSRSYVATNTLTQSKVIWFGAFPIFHRLSSHLGPSGSWKFFPMHWILISIHACSLCEEFLVLIPIVDSWGLLGFKIQLEWPELVAWVP